MDDLIHRNQGLGGLDREIVMEAVDQDIVLVHDREGDVRFRQEDVEDLFHVDIQEAAAGQVPHREGKDLQDVEHHQSLSLLLHLQNVREAEA